MLPNIPDVPASRIRVMQVIVFALMAGVIMFGLIAMAITAKQAPGDPTLAFVAAAFAGIAIPMSVLVPMIISGGMVRAAFAESGDADLSNTVSKLANVFQTKSILGVALLEGAAFFNLVVYIVTALAWPLVIAGILVMLMALSFPTPGSVDNWIERRFEELQFNQ